MPHPDSHPSRRHLLAGAAALALGPAARALARPHHHKPAAASPPVTPGPASSAAASAGPAAPTPATTPLGPFDTIASQACILDQETGAVLLDKAADSPMTPSSLTKLMTAYLTFAALAAGRVTLATSFAVSEKAWRMGGSKMFVPYPGSVAIADLIRGMIIQSGNDACIVLAEGLNGSEDRFVARMNDQAARFGLRNTHFVNCTGWPDPGHVSSARDIATIARRLIADFPQYYHFFGERDFTFDGIHQGNRNTLVDRGIADGLKTGHTEAGGYGECSSAARAGRRSVVVVNGMDSMHDRAHESERLLDWSLDNFQNATLLAQGHVLDRVAVYLGTAPDVGLAGATTLVMTLPLAWRRQARFDLLYSSPVPAPVLAGQKLGTLRITLAPDQMVSLDLVAANAVPRLPLGARALRVLDHYLTGV